MENQSYLRTLQTLFFSLLTGQILMAGVLWFAVPPPRTPDILLDDPVGFALIALWAVCQFLAYFLGQKKIVDARAQSSFDEKTAQYRTANILRWALIEGSTLACLVGFFFVSANYLLLGLALAGVAHFAIYAPHRAKVVQDLELNAAEEALLE
jgi:hypothetical protein